MSQQELADPAAGAGEGEERTGELPRSGSSSRLNAGAPEYVPRAAGPPPPPQLQPKVIRVFAAPPPPPFFAAMRPPPPPPMFEYYPMVGGAAVFDAVGDREGEREEEEEGKQAAAEGRAQQPARDGFADDALHKIKKQVEYYFSDINLATTEHLMRFIAKDPEGYVPMSVVAGFKKIKSLLQSSSMLASALRTSTKLVVTEDGTRVKRVQPFTESDLEELQARIIVAENLPDDHCYQNLMKLFSAVGSVRTIRTCYPQTPNGSGPVTNRSAKLDMLFPNKLHAFVEYDTIKDAEKAILELNDESWRNGLRVRLLNTCMTKGGKGRRGGHEVDGHGVEDGVSTSNQPHDKHSEETSQLSDAFGEQMSDENIVDTSRGRGRSRGRGGRSQGRGYHHNNSNNNQHHYHNHQQQHNYQNSNNHSGAHPVGTPPSSHPVKTEQQQQPQQQPQPLAVANKLPPGPRMPDGTRGFTIGRGKPQTPTPSASACEP